MDHARDAGRSTAGGRQAQSEGAAPRTRGPPPDLSGIWYLHFDGCGRFGCADYQAGPEFFDFGASCPAACPTCPGPRRW
jgi:hypothetical protein